ncbi:MAG: hypothetical protein APF84_12590 [Gracilibacter sp. BRH_c7a]|nr:MAG: hypothetical protein APF84_12590 [Gracilibacter sp. BRH_c7a]
MEYILNTDLFDEDIGIKFKEIIEPDKEIFDKEKEYDFTASFHVNLLNDPRFDTFYVPKPSIFNKGTKADIVHDVLSTQLNRLLLVLKEKEIKTNLTAIQGEKLETTDLIKIKITEDISGTIVNRKKKTRTKFQAITPNLHYAQQQIAKTLAEMIYKSEDLEQGNLL